MVSYGSHRRLMIRWKRTPIITTFVRRLGSSNCSFSGVLTCSSTCLEFIGTTEESQKNNKTTKTGCYAHPSLDP
eukprot:UN05693